MLASFAFARKSWATSLFRLTPTIPGLGITTSPYVNTFYV
jgi:hypothetical protein